MNNTHTRRLTWLLFFGQGLNSVAYIAGTTIGSIVGAALLTDSLTHGERGRVQSASDLSLGLVSAFGSLQSGVLFAWAGFAYLSAIGLAIGLLPLLLAIRHLARRVGQPSLASG